MRTTVELDSDLEKELSQVVQLTKSEPEAVLHQAIKEGLNALVSKLHAPRPDGYFAADYEGNDERVTLEAAMANVQQQPER